MTATSIVAELCAPAPFRIALPRQATAKQLWEVIIEQDLELSHHIQTPLNYEITSTVEYDPLSRHVVYLTKAMDMGMARLKAAKYLFLIGTCLMTGDGLASAANQKTEDGNKGITVEDLGRALKSAVQNVEKEIPKIGSAIGETFKKITEKSSNKKTSQEPAGDKK